MLSSRGEPKGSQNGPMLIGETGGKGFPRTGVSLEKGVQQKICYDSPTYVGSVSADEASS